MTGSCAGRVTAGMSVLESSKGREEVHDLTPPLELRAALGLAGVRGGSGSSPFIDSREGTNRTPVSSSSLFQRSHRGSDR